MSAFRRKTRFQPVWSLVAVLVLTAGVFASGSARPAEAAYPTVAWPSGWANPVGRGRRS